MTSRERFILMASLVLSVLYWSWAYGTYVGSMLVLCILTHEYGHYYWMRKEGIINRSMMMMPPFGAIAYTKEPWPSRGAEARIALAGPAFGLLSVLFPLTVWLVYGDYESRISIFLACILNLFNILLPVAILDGGRVIKSVLFSISRPLGFGFYYFSFGILLILTLNFPSPFTLILSIFLYLGTYDELKASTHNPVFMALAPMTGREMLVSSVIYLVIVASFIFILVTNGVYFADMLSYMSLR